jgi:hypothetical protein
MHTQSIDGNSIVYVLNTLLPLDYKNPKETIDTFLSFYNEVL